MNSYKLLSDSELLDLLRTGDKIAYTEIYDRYKWLLHKHACRKLGDREEARDVVQGIFEMLWIKRETFSSETNLSGYLYSSIRNRILNVIAHQKVESKYIKSLENFYSKGEYITDNQIREKELTLLIEKGISSLPPKMREVFELSRKANLSHKEISETLDLSEQTVRTQVKNALRILRLTVGAIAYLAYIYNF